MKKLWYLGISLVLALTMVAPAATALAKGPTVTHANATSAVYATGTVTNITEGNVKKVITDPANPYGFYWIVTNRQVSLSLSGRNANGDFVLTYAGIFGPDQSGSLIGVMKGDHKQFVVKGVTQTASDTGMTVPTGLPEGYPQVAPLYRLPISGDWKGTDGTRAAGTFSGSVVFIPTADGQHIAAVVPSLSYFEMDLTSPGNGGGGD